MKSTEVSGAANPMELAQMVALDSARTGRDAARAQRDAARQSRELAFADRVEAMEDAATQRLLGGVVGGGLQCAGGLVGAGTGSQAWTQAGSGAAELGGAFFEWSASAADIDAEQAGQRAEVAGEVAQQAGDSMREAVERSGRMLQRLESIDQAQQQAMLAAIGRPA